MNIHNYFHEQCGTEFKELYPRATEQQIEFAETISNDMYYFMRKNDHAIHVVPARCGFGKGTLQKVFLNNVMTFDLLYSSEKHPLPFRGNNTDGVGVIYVTDRLKRLDDIRKYIGDKAYYLRSEADAGIPVNEQMKEQLEYPILLMTTQRYFQMSKSQIEALQNWSGGKRKLILFDEKPFFYEQFRIDTEMMNSVDVELNRLSERRIENKSDIINSFNELRQNINKEWDAYTNWLRENSLHFTWIRPEQVQDDRFFELIKGIDFSDDVTKKIKALKTRKENGCIYVNPTHGSSNERYYSVLLNNLEKILPETFNYWIFDGSADFDYEYSIAGNTLNFCMEYVEDKKTETAKARLIHQTINRTSFRAEKINEVVENVLNSADKNCFIITYKNAVNKIQHDYPGIKCLYFGNTRGQNEMREEEYMIQIGLNRLPDFYYFSMWLLFFSDEQEKLNKMSQEEIANYIEITTHASHGLYDNEQMEKIFESCMQVDFEQNLFRSKLRNYDNTDEVKIDIVCAKYYFPMLQVVLEKYGIPWDEVIEKKTIVYAGTKIERLMDFLEEMDLGTEFTTADLYEVIDVMELNSKKRSKKLEEVLMNHPNVRSILNDFRHARGKYRKIYEVCFD